MNKQPRKCGGGARLTGLCVGALLIACIPVASQVVSCVPRLLAGLLLGHLGVELVKEGLLNTWPSRLPLDLTPCLAVQAWMRWSISSPHLGST